MPEVALWTGLTLGVTPAITALVRTVLGPCRRPLRRQDSGSTFPFEFRLRDGRSWRTRPSRGTSWRCARSKDWWPDTARSRSPMAARSAPRDQMARRDWHGPDRAAHRPGDGSGDRRNPGARWSASQLVPRGGSGLRHRVHHAHGHVPGALARRRSRRRRKNSRGVPNMLAFENFLLLMVVIFGLALVDRSFGPVLLLHSTSSATLWRACPCVAGVLFSVLAVSWCLRPSARRGAAEADVRARGDRRRPHSRRPARSPFSLAAHRSGCWRRRCGVLPVSSLGTAMTTSFYRSRIGGSA